ncbi:MAG: PAS domain S-box protein [Cyclobacteriaceae bacterium]|nr:PAS domain S-box protein [Cyclobacteriaceae bacterium]
MNNQDENILDSDVMLENMTESVLITNADLESPGPYIIYVNRAFEKMTGWNRDELIGRSPRILQGPKTDHGIFLDLREKLLNGEIWRGRTVNYRKNGSEFDMEWSIVPIMDPTGNIHRLLAIQRDVTEIVATEKKLQQVMAEERKRRMEIEKTNSTLNKLIARQKRTLELFVKYVPEPVVSRTLAGQHDKILEGEQLEIALLFCDIRSFTSISERLNPNQIVNFLNIYYSMMSEVINRHKGVINQFVGDEIFVSFGAPIPIPDPEVAAVRCALDMVSKLNEINDRLRSMIQENVVTGIGINYGPVIAGNLGSDDRLSYSITGDAVNTAKRIESLTRNLPNAILISESIYDKTRNLIMTIPWGEVEIKGKNKKVKVFQVIDYKK